MKLNLGAGIKTVTIGPGQSGQGHKLGEYIITDRVREFTHVMETLLSKNN